MLRRTHVVCGADVIVRMDAPGGPGGLGVGGAVGVGFGQDFRQVLIGFHMFSIGFHMFSICFHWFS